MTHHIKLSIKQQIQSLKNAILQLPELPFSEILSEHSLQQIIEDSPSQEKSHLHHTGDAESFYSTGIERGQIM